MKLLFLSYWGVNEGLSAATVIPHLKILSEIDKIEKIVFCSIERNLEEVHSTNFQISKVLHVPLRSKSRGNVFLTKTMDFFSMPKAIIKLCNVHRIDKIICRSPLAGALAYLVSRKMNIPFVVESFEPHAQSMIESGVWTVYDPRYWIELFFEKQQLKKAAKIFPVSHHFKSRLIEWGVDSKKIIVMPCCVSMANFGFDNEKRALRRRELWFDSNCQVGIYVGKYGGIYYDDEAFELYKFAFNFFDSNFRLIILTEQNHEAIRSKLSKRGIDMTRVVVIKTNHNQVNEYLSASDFAFSTIKPVPSRLYCSPIKNGEYWANGLPILTEQGIGDDSDIIQFEGGGVILERENVLSSFNRLKDILAKGRGANATAIERIASKHRSMEIVRKIYENEFK
ncbi:MAG: glycosyltransferase [Bacteroidetes bacterium]|nr:glycosyltransferase [Bacteroidota bacterium]